MADFNDLLGIVKDEFLHREGVQIFVKTNLGPKIKIYDSDNPETVDGDSIVKVGIKIQERDGDTIVSAGGWPETNYLYAGVIVVSVLSLMYVIVQGIKRQIPK